MKCYQRSACAFTLVETLVSIVVLGIVAATVLPIIFATADMYSGSTSARRASEQAAYAIDRVVRMLREAPAGTSQGTIGVTSANASSIFFTDATGVSLNGTSLELRSAAGTGVLCDNVSDFELTYLAQDGVTSVLATPATAQRIHIRIVVSGFELRSTAFIRARMLQP